MVARMHLAVITLLGFVEAIQGVCNSQLTATELKSYESHNSYSSNKECTYTVTPGSYYTRNKKKYYLEITWKKFDINGDMPSCSKDYVEVFLTRSQTSIGKFCSNNAAKPFQMYSHDGYGKIRLRFSSSHSRSNFGFYYQLKKYDDGIQGSYSMSTFCQATYSSSGSGLVYSSGWPGGYTSSTSKCHHSVHIPSKYAETKVVFMDLDLYKASWFCYSKEYVELKGSETSSGYKYYISGKVCSNTLSSITSYLAKERYLEFTFSRKYGSGKDNRGFVAGYISYGKRSKSDDKAGLIAGTVAKKLALKIAGPAVVFIIVFAIYLVYLRWKKRRRRRMAEEILERCAQVNAAKNEEETAPLAQGTTSDSTTNPYPPAYTQAYPTAYPTAIPAYPGAENALQPQPYPMPQQPFPAANQEQYPQDGTNIASQEKGVPPYPQVGAAVPLSSRSYPAAAGYPPQESWAVDANASYPPSNVPPSGGSEVYPTVPPPAYNSVVH